MEIEWCSTSYTYTESIVKNYVQSLPGIYFIGSKIPRVGWRIVYLGETKNLRESLLEHLSPQELDEDIKRYVSYECDFLFSIITQKAKRIRAFKYTLKQHSSLKPNGNSAKIYPILIKPLQ